MKRFLREREVRDRTGIRSSVQLRRLEKRGLFPVRVKLVPGSGPRGAVAWLEAEIDAWIDQRAEQRDPAA